MLPKSSYTREQQARLGQNEVSPIRNAKAQSLVQKVGYEELFQIQHK